MLYSTCPASTNNIAQVKPNIQPKKDSEIIHQKESIKSVKKESVYLGKNIQKNEYIAIKLELERETIYTPFFKRIWDSRS